MPRWRLYNGQVYRLQLTGRDRLNSSVCCTHVRDSNSGTHFGIERSCGRLAFSGTNGGVVARDLREGPTASRQARV
jgi:hypothetical protein